jgi:hypothetical protein
VSRQTDSRDKARSHPDDSDARDREQPSPMAPPSFLDDEFFACRSARPARLKKLAVIGSSRCVHLHD